MVYLHVNTEVWFWCSSGILVFPEPNTPKLAAAERIVEGELSVANFTVYSTVDNFFKGLRGKPVACVA